MSTYYVQRKHQEIQQIWKYLLSIHSESGSLAESRLWNIGYWNKAKQKQKQEQAEKGGMIWLLNRMTRKLYIWGNNGEIWRKTERREGTSNVGLWRKTFLNTEQQKPRGERRLDILEENTEGRRCQKWMPEAGSNKKWAHS